MYTLISPGDHLRITCNQTDWTRSNNNVINIPRTRLHPTPPHTPPHPALSRSMIQRDHLQRSNKRCAVIGEPGSPRVYIYIYMCVYMCIYIYICVRVCVIVYIIYILNRFEISLCEKQLGLLCASIIFDSELHAVWTKIGQAPDQ